MKNKKLLASILLILISMAWGGSFVAQSKGGAIVGPFTFGFLRFLMAGIAILPVVAIHSKKNKTAAAVSYSSRELI